MFVITLKLLDIVKHNKIYKDVLTIQNLFGTAVFTRCIATTPAITIRDNLAMPPAQQTELRFKSKYAQWLRFLEPLPVFLVLTPSLKSLGNGGLGKEGMTRVLGGIGNFLPPPFFVFFCFIFTWNLVYNKEWMLRFLKVCT